MKLAVLKEDILLSARDDSAFICPLVDVLSLYALVKSKCVTKPELLSIKGADLAAVFCVGIIIQFI